MVPFKEKNNLLNLLIKPIQMKDGFCEAEAVIYVASDSWNKIMSLLVC